MERKTRVIFGVILACIILCGSIVALVAGSLATTPDFTELKSSVVVKFTDKNDKTTEFRLGPKAPGWVPLSSISKNLIAAVVTSEDSSFFQHEGLDYFEIKESIRKDLETGKFARGGSTITQQLIKNVYLSRQKTLWRKIKEMIWARQLEKVLNKSEILALYLNLIEWGPGIFGIRQAAAHYFATTPDILSAKQSAFLAMIIPSPVKSYTYYKNRKLTTYAERRTAQILRVMNRMNFIDEAGYHAALAESLWGEAGISEGAADAEPGWSDNEVPEAPVFDSSPPIFDAPVLPKSAPQTTPISPEIPSESSDQPVDPTVE